MTVSVTLPDGTEVQVTREYGGEWTALHVIPGEPDATESLSLIVHEDPAERTVTLSEEAHAVLCGIVQPSDEVDAAGIFSETWGELREAFPLAAFRAYAEAREDFYTDDLLDPAGSGYLPEPPWDEGVTPRRKDCAERKEG